MKTKYFFLAAAAALFAACSSDDGIAEQQQQAQQQAEQVPVAFGAYVNRGTTRAGSPGTLKTTTDTDKELSLQTAGFGVFGYYTDNVPFSQNSTPNFMYNQQVSTSAWTYTPVKYWPNEYGTNAISDGVDRLTFFAYAPWVNVTPETGRAVGDQTSGIVGMTSNVATGDPYVKYFVNMDPGKSVDLCWGVSAGGFTSTVDGPDANAVADGGKFVDLVKPLTGAKIKFDFKHALAKLNVQIDADVDNVVPKEDKALATGTKIYVRSVTFEGFALKGLLNLNAAASEGPLWYELSSTNTKISSATSTIYDGRRDGKEGQANASATNELPAGLNKVIISDDGNTKSGVTNTPVNLFESSFASPDKADPVYVIPVDGEPLSVTIVYDVETEDNQVAGYLSDGTKHGSTIENKITKQIIAGGLKAGYAYTVKLHLGMNSVKFDAVVRDWTAAPDTDVALPDNK